MGFHVVAIVAPSSRVAFMVGMLCARLRVCSLSLFVVNMLCLSSMCMQRLQYFSYVACAFAFWFYNVNLVQIVCVMLLCIM